MFPKLEDWYKYANIHMKVMICFRGKATGMSVFFLLVDEEQFRKTLNPIKYFSIALISHTDKKIQLRESLVCLQFQVTDIHKGCQVRISSIY